MTPTVNQQDIVHDWAARGFSCALWVDPPGEHWEAFVHDKVELVIVAVRSYDDVVSLQERIACAKTVACCSRTRSAPTQGIRYP